MIASTGDDRLKCRHRNPRTSSRRKRHARTQPSRVVSFTFGGVGSLRQGIGVANN
jgi:hypothetical protein